MWFLLSEAVLFRCFYRASSQYSKTSGHKVLCFFVYFFIWGNTFFGFCRASSQCSMMCTPQLMWFLLTKIIICLCLYRTMFVDIWSSNELAYFIRGSYFSVSIDPIHMLRRWVVLMWFGLFYLEQFFVCSSIEPVQNVRSDVISAVRDRFYRADPKGPKKCGIQVALLLLSATFICAFSQLVHDVQRYMILRWLCNLYNLK